MSERPDYGPDRIVRGLALPRRVALIAVGLGGLVGATVIGMLWATEPTELPMRTRLAFGALMLVGVAWAAYATSALFRRPWFAIDRMVAGWLAVTFSTLMTVGLVLIAVTRGGTTDLVVAAGLGLPLIVVACVILIRASTYRATLRARLRRLEDRRPAPIGPLALALRHRRDGAGSLPVVVIAVALGVALVVGFALLLLR